MLIYCFTELSKNYQASSLPMNLKIENFQENMWTVDQLKLQKSPFGAFS